jgi:hypothetical protein
MAGWLLDDSVLRGAAIVIVEEGCFRLDGADRVRAGGARRYQAAPLLPELVVGPATQRRSVRT